MAEDAAVAVPAANDQPQEQEPQLPVEQGVEEPAAEEAAPADEAAAAEGGNKRSREEAGADGEEPDAKRAAPAEAEGQPNAADGADVAAAAPAPADNAIAEESGAEPAEAAPVGAAEAAVANGSDNPGHVASGHQEGGDAVHAPAFDNQAHTDNPELAGPPPVKEGLGTTTNEDGSISEMIAVSKHLVGKLIGKAGTTIQQLQASTATNIQIDQTESTDHPDTKIVTIRGAPDNVAKAKDSIKQLLEEALAPQEGEVEDKIPCPAGIVGRIIGRGGETIRSLQQSSGAHILVDQNYPEGQDRMVIIKGQRENVTRASSMINELIAGEPGSASAIISKHSIGINLTVTCPKSMVGRVIGKGGETIKGLQRKYHTSIQVGSQVDQQGDPMTITITGPKHTAHLCQQEINALINEPPPPFGGPGPRGMGYPRGPPGYGPGPYGGPAPYGGPPPAPYGAPYGSPYGAPYGSPYGAPYPSPGGYGSYGAPAPAPYSGGAGGYGGGQPGYSQAGGYGAGGAGYGQGGYGGQAGGYGGAAAGCGGYGGDGASGGAGSGGAGGYGGGATAAAPAAAGGSVWQAMQDDQGRTYYYNSQTGVSQWEKPAEMP